MQTSSPAVVLSLSGKPLEHGPLAVARSLGRLGVPVHVAHRGGRLPVDASRYVAGRIRLGPRDSVVEQLLEAAAASDTRPVLIPVDDDGALLVEDAADQLSGRFLLPRRERGLARRLADKRQLTQTCHHHGIPTPATWFPTSLEEALEAATLADYPLVVKAVDPLLLTHSAAGARSVTLARDRAELASAYRLLATGGPGNVLVQEHIPGGPEAVCLFNGYFDHRSQCRFGGTGVKLRQARPDAAPCTLGVTRDNDHVRLTSERLLSELGYTGIVDLDFRYDARDGRFKLLDVNPRVGGTFRLFTGEGGLDVVRALYLDLTGQPVPSDSVPAGRAWHDEPHDLLGQGTHRGRARTPWAQWLSSASHADEHAWWAADDRRPFLHMCRHVVALVPKGLAQVAGSRGRRATEAVAAPVVAPSGSA